MTRMDTRSRVLIGLLLLLAMFWLFSGLSTTEPLTYSEFRAAVDDGRVASATFTDQSIEGELTDGEPFTSTLPPQTVVGQDGIEEFLRDNGVEIDARPSGGGIGALLLSLAFPLLLFIGFFWFLSRQARGQMGGMSQIGKSTAKLHKPHEPTTRFADVAGYSEVKEEVREVVAFLREPDKFRSAGAEVPKGMLLVGPPGTGKTLLARATAGEAGVPFITVTGSDFMEMFVGVGASRVRDLFKTARANAPCIVFIDELDSIGRKRGAGLGGGHDEREQARELHTIGRERASLRLDEAEKRAVAYHEGGHALAAFLEEEADPVYKVTVLPIGMALGGGTQLPIDERHIYLRSYLDAKLKVMLGGRAAEMVVLGQPTTGGQHDLVQATKLARAIVREFGMGKLGPVGYGDERQVFLGEEITQGREYSDRTAELIDEEVRSLLTTALDDVIADFIELRAGLDAMADLLVEKESLTGRDALAAVRGALSATLRDRLRGSASIIVDVAETVEDRIDEADERVGMA